MATISYVLRDAYATNYVGAVISVGGSRTYNVGQGLIDGGGSVSASGAITGGTITIDAADQPLVDALDGYAGVRRSGSSDVGLAAATTRTGALVVLRQEPVGATAGFVPVLQSDGRWVAAPDGSSGAATIKAWSATAFVVAGQPALSPSGQLITRIADGTTRASYDATEAAQWAIAVPTYRGDSYPLSTVLAAGDTFAVDGVVWRSTAAHTSSTSAFNPASSNYAPVTPPLLPGRTKPPAPQRKLLDAASGAFQPGNAWTKSFGSGAFAADTVDYLIGSQSVQLTTDGAGGLHHVDLTGFSAINMTGKQFRLRSKIDQPLKLGQFSTLLSSDNLAHTRTITITGASAQYAMPNDWFDIPLNIAEATGAATPFDITAINAIRIRLQDNNTAVPVTAHFQLVEVQAATTPGAAVIWLDDCYLNQFQNAVPILQKYGLRANIAVIAQALGTSTFAALTDVKNAQSMGHDIVPHCYTLASHNSGFQTLTDTQAEQEIAAVRAWMRTNGLHGGDHLAIPGGQYTASEQVVLRKYFKSARGIGGGVGGSVPAECWPPDFHRMRAQVMSQSNYASIATAGGAVDKIAAQGGVLHIIQHGVSASGGGTNETSTANFDTAMAYISSLVTAGTIKNPTMAELFDRGITGA
jgi:peptidoglycan/xylan/chitin deacetylase (PgdA/CDA1 family)